MEGFEGFYGGSDFIPKLGEMRQLAFEHSLGRCGVMAKSNRPELKLNGGATGKHAFAREGFDGAVRRREDDFLRRWPFALEVYHAITTSPPEWSTRVGVYAPWGVGKTSVLRFVESMAERDEHLVVWFNPWTHVSSAALWQAFVQGIAKKLKERTGRAVKGATKRAAKGLVRPVGQLAAKIAGVFHEGVGGAAETGLEHVQNFFAFGPNEVAELLALLGGKRLIVLIDDLDRADPKLVPQILLALKELLDVPSVAFVCAFDPAIVGRAMHDYHPGFDDGLRFLEKIIDYPCWLPEARKQDLENLALRDSRTYCPFVPEWALRKTLPMVADTPRAVRQFVRHLRLLELSARRYHEHEINWVVSLATQVLQLKLPSVGVELLHDTKFWAHVVEESFAAELNDDEGEKLNASIRARAEQLTKHGHLKPADQEWLVDWLRLVVREMGMDAWTVGTRPRLDAQQPAITGRELMEFMDGFGNKAPDPAKLRLWLAKQEAESGTDAYAECLRRLIAARHKLLSESYDTLVVSERHERIAKAESLHEWFQVLLLELGVDTNSGFHRWSKDDLVALRDEFARSSGLRGSDIELAQRESEVGLLLKMIETWSGDLRVWGEVIGTSITHGEFDGRGAWWSGVWRRLSDAWQLRLAAQVAQEFVQQPDYLRSSSAVRSLSDLLIREWMLDGASLLWRTQGKILLAALREKTPSEATRRNAIQLLSILLPEGRQNEHATKYAKALLGHEEIAQALFAAATSKPLVVQGVARLFKPAKWCRAQKITLSLPDWWTDLYREIETQEKAVDRGDLESADSDD